MLLQVISCNPTDVDADGIFLDAQITATGNQTLNGAGVSGGVVTLATAQLITFTSGAGDNVSGVNFTITGTDIFGQPQTETIAGPNNNTVSSTKYYKTVTAISADATTGAGVTTSCGWSEACISDLIRTNLRHTPMNIGFGVVVSGTVNYTVQHTFESIPFSSTTYPTTWFDHDTIAAKTGNEDGNYAFPVTAVRLKLNSATGGSVTGTFVQAGV